jgi:hypothetical protein
MALTNKEALRLVQNLVDEREALVIVGTLLQRLFAQETSMADHEKKMAERSKQLELLDSQVADKTARNAENLARLDAALLEKKKAVEAEVNACRCALELTQQQQMAEKVAHEEALASFNARIDMARAEHQQLLRQIEAATQQRAALLSALGVSA